MFNKSQIENLESKIKKLDSTVTQLVKNQFSQSDRLLTLEDQVKDLQKSLDSLENFVYNPQSRVVRSKRSRKLDA